MQEHTFCCSKLTRVSFSDRDFRFLRLRLLILIVSAWGIVSRNILLISVVLGGGVILLKLLLRILLEWWRSWACFRDRDNFCAFLLIFMLVLFVAAPGNDDCSAQDYEN